MYLANQILYLCLCSCRSLCSAIIMFRRKSSANTTSSRVPRRRLLPILSSGRIYIVGRSCQLASNYTPDYCPWVLQILSSELHFLKKGEYTSESHIRPYHSSMVASHQPDISSPFPTRINALRDFLLAKLQQHQRPPRPNLYVP